MRLGFRVVIVALGVLALPVSAAAQYTPAPRTDRPYRGLFGGGHGDTEQLLSVSLTMSGGRDTNVLKGSFLAPDQLSTSTAQRFSANFGQADATLSYSLNRKRFGMNAFGSAAGLYYPDLPHPVTSYYNAGLGASLKVRKSGNLTFSQTLSYQPFYFLSAFTSLGEIAPGVPALPNVATAVQASDYWQEGTAVGFSTHLSKKATFQAAFSNQQTTSAEHVRDLNATTAGAHLGFGLTKYLSLVLGYTRSQYDTRAEDLSGRTNGNAFDGGLSYARSLSLTRRLSFSFNTGVAGIRDRNENHYTAVGHASLVREIGRSWAASLAYDRQLSFIAAFLQPVQTDSVAAGLGGLITKRLQFASSAGYTRGVVGFNTPNNGLWSEFASVSLTYGLSQTLGLGVAYTDYFSHFGSGVTLPTGIFNEGDRETVRVFLTAWVPLLSTKARPDASR